MLSPQTFFPGENSNWFTIKYGICIVPILSILMLFQKLLRMQSLECMECWRFWKTYFFKIKKFHWYGNDIVSWYFHISTDCDLYQNYQFPFWNFWWSGGSQFEISNRALARIFLVLKYYFHHQQNNRNIFWCLNIIPPRIFLVLKYYPQHQWNNIVIPTPGNFMGKLRSSVMGVNFLYYPIEFALTLSFQAFTKEFILSWEVTNKVIFAICIDPSSTINPTQFLLANIVILFNLFPLVLCWRNPYFIVKVHSRGSQSHFLTTTSHISICQHKASITKIHKKYFS